MALAGEAQDPVEARDFLFGLQRHDAVLSVEETPQGADRHAHVPAENSLGPGEESSGATPAPETCNPAEGTFVLARSKSDSELMDSNDTVSVRDVLELYNRLHESTQRTQRDIRVRAKLEDWLVPRDSIQFGAELGRGSGGIVYQARWRGLQCAAKTLHYEACVSRQYDRTCAAAESNSRKDLMNELTVLSRLRHPNLVLFLGACFGGDELIVLSEFIENGNFEQYVESCKGSQGWAPSKLEVYSWSMQLARALAFLHNGNPVVVHRDLKPCNLLLDRAGNLKVCDFGLSRTPFKIKEKMEHTDAYEMTGRTGTFRYMAPEVFLEDPHYTEAVDIFSAAMLMWYFVMGVVPFAALPPQVSAQATALTGARPSLADVIKKHSSLLAVTIERCWMQDPAERPSALQLVKDLELCYRVKSAIRRDLFFSSPARCVQASALLHQHIIGPCDTVQPFVFKVYQRSRWNAWKALGTMGRQEAEAELRHLLDRVNFSDETFRRSSGADKETCVLRQVTSSSSSGDVAAHAAGSRHQQRLKRALSLPVSPVGFAVLHAAAACRMPP